MARKVNLDNSADFQKTTFNNSDLPSIFAFPKDGNSWRIDWFGDIAFPNRLLRRTRPSVLVHLSRVLDTSFHENPAALLSADSTFVTKQHKVLVSVGTLPLLCIGDIWRDGQLELRPDYELEHFPDLEINVETAVLIKAGLNLEEKGFIEMLIYKYMPTERFFTNFKLRFTPPDDLNDPLELVPEIRLPDPAGYARGITARNFEPAITRYQIEHPDVPLKKIRALVTAAARKLESSMDAQEKEREHFRTFMKVTNRNVGILSLTTDPSSAPMWAHYADTYKGLAVGFDSDSDFFRPTKGEPKNCGELVKVAYTNMPPIAYVEAGKIDYPKELFFSKAKCWSYESEWRVIKYLPHAQEVIEVPNGLPIHLFEVPLDAIREVIFGFRVSSTTRSVVETALAERAPHAARKKIEFVPNVGLQVMNC